MTYRERRETRAAKLEEWAAKRAAKAEAGFNVGEQYRGDTAFWTQPGRIPERDRVFAAHQRAGTDAAKATSMATRAAGIASQLEGAIYSDDTDAIERLEERITNLEKQRDMFKAFNVAIRKGLPLADFEAQIGRELQERTRKNYTESLPTRSALPAYVLTNLGADIRRNKQRLDQLKSAAELAAEGKPSRVTTARRAGTCDRCGEAIAIGAYIGKTGDEWSHVYADGDAWKRCDA